MVVLVVLCGLWFMVCGCLRFVTCDVVGWVGFSISGLHYCVFGCLRVLCLGLSCFVCRIWVMLSGCWC